MVDELIYWEPIKGLSKKYSLSLMVDFTSLIMGSTHEFRLALFNSANPKKKTTVIFESSVRAYRVTHVSKWNKSNRSTRGDHIDSLNWTFFKVKNSPYLQWIAENTGGVYPQEGYTHFSFITTNAIIDVLNFDEPIVKISDQ